MKSKTVFIFLLLHLLLATFNFVSAQKKERLDYLITNALVFDGTLNEPVKRDVGVKGDRIFLNKNKTTRFKADKVINAEGLYLCPGFIDPHTHNGPWLNSPDSIMRLNLPSLTQGVTTVFIGNDGGGTFEVEKLFKKYEDEGIGTNVAVFVGLSPVREAVLGKEDVAPDESQLEEMKTLVSRAMAQGAFGLSTGLYYAPQTYARTDEVIALAAVAKKYNGIYDTHLRSESNGLVDAINETIAIGKATGIPLMISHIKALGPAAWGKSDEVIRIIETARKEGMEIFANQYPYIASNTSVKAMTIPAWAQAGGNEKMVERLKKTDANLINEISKNLALRGGDSRITISQNRDNSLIGKSLHEVALQWNKSPEEAILKMLIEDPSTSGVSFSMDEADVENFMKRPWVLTGSDGGGRHPRTYGTFVRKIKKYSLEDSVLPLNETIYNSTGHSAELLGIENRGFIKDGFYADIVIFDPKKIRDEATFEEPELYASGINHVFVNGKHVIKDGVPTNERSGRPIRYRWPKLDKTQLDKK